MKLVNYPVLMHKHPDSDYGVTVPDLPGCFSAGRTIDEALEMAREAIELHMKGLIEYGKRVPKPSPIQKHHRNGVERGGIWAIVSVNSTKFKTRSPRTARKASQRAR